MTVRPRLSPTGVLSRRRKKSVSPARSTIRGFPRHAVRYCLRRQAIELGQVDYVVFYDKPFLKFERLLETYLAFAPAGFPFLSHGDAAVDQRKAVSEDAAGDRRLAAFAPATIGMAGCSSPSTTRAMRLPPSFASPFEEAAVLTMDGVGEWATTSVAIGRGNTLEMIGRSISRIRSDCSIRPSPTTPASKSIRASTR